MLFFCYLNFKNVVYIMFYCCWLLRILRSRYFVAPVAKHRAGYATVTRDSKNECCEAAQHIVNKKNTKKMKLSYWLYAGPAHIGSLKIASSFKNVHALMHAPLGDDFFNVMRSMLERERDFTSVKTTLVDRHVLAKGSQTKVIQNLQRQYKEENPDFILLTPTCTSSILQEDLSLFVKRACQNIKTPILLADVNHYRINELQAGDKTLEQILQFILNDTLSDKQPDSAKRQISSLAADPSVGYEVTRGTEKLRVLTQKPSVNILGITTLGFHHQHDIRELQRLLFDLGFEVNEIIPEGSSLKSIQNLPSAWFNIVPYRECGLMAAEYLKNEFGMPYTAISPIGVLQTKEFILELEALKNQIAKEISHSRAARSNNVHPPHQNFMPSLDASNFDYEAFQNETASQHVLEYINEQSSFLCQAAWFSRSIDCQNLTGKRAIVFGDSTHAAAFTKLLVRELGLKVVLAGTYCKNDSSWFRDQVQGYTQEILITEDYNQVSEMIEKLEPSAIFGTQMERHIGKRLGIPTAVISAPIHIQNFNLSYRPFLGYEGANYIADLVYNTYTLGMEEHLLSLFGGHDSENISDSEPNVNCESNTKQHFDSQHNMDSVDENGITTPVWTDEAKKELSFIPSFVRNKVKRRTEEFAKKINQTEISLDILYQAKAANEIA
jgi:light-independent protochlorophyllide reductase subunit B